MSERTQTSAAAAPLPPLALASRVGPLYGDDPYAYYLQQGREARELIASLLPAGWSWEGKRVLDFGCGAGRTLRHFLDEAESAEFWGCDIHAGSIDWLKQALSPPLHPFLSGISPPLPIEDGYFDLVYAMSVFTHIGDQWADWALEMRRVLATDGILISSYLGEGMFEALLGEPYEEDRVGMLVVERDAQVDNGPWVFHSEWWLRKHWGLPFDIERIDRPKRGQDGRAEPNQTFFVARPSASLPTREDLERIDGDDPREVAALRTNVRRLRRELSYQRAVTDKLADELEASRLGPRERLRRAVLDSRFGPSARAIWRRLRRR